MKQTLQDQIKECKAAFESTILTITTEQALDALRVQFLGKKGNVPSLNDVLSTLSIEEKREFGPQLQSLRLNIETKINEHRTAILAKMLEQSREKNRYFDVTLERPLQLQGSLHPLTIITNELEDIFRSIGFSIVHDIELEDDWHNFTALNIPENHPARDSHDTFWIKNLPGRLLRTHTSTVQIRTMQRENPPFAIFSTGRVFRNEATDASHDFQFMQGEPLLVDKNVSIANLLDCAEYFLQTFFNNKQLAIRVRPSYFPFVEPGLEIDLTCPFCKTGCSVCKKTKWIEIMGAGMIHPNVLQSCDISPDEYQGFAMGFGISRLAMLKYGIDDVRLLHGNNYKFLQQFNHLE